jgi:hypothetical protein
MSMADERIFDHEPDPELGAALRRALEPADQTAFVARVLARYDQALAEATIPTWELLARWSRRGLAAAAAAAVLGGFLLGRELRAPDAPATLDAAIAPADGPGLTALVTASGPPDASVVFASLVEQR